MSKKKNYEYFDASYKADVDGLKQRRLKVESRWKFNPNSNYVEDEDGELLEEFDDLEEEDRS